MALKFHPDRNPDNKSAEENFKEATEAYEVLGDEQRKTAYDQFGHAGVSGAGAGGFGASGGDFGFGNINDIFGDIFGDFFGGGGASTRSRGAAGRSSARRGSDLQYNLNISFNQAAQGGEVKISIEKDVQCTKCHGSGVKEGSKQKTCYTCAGTGQVHFQQGFFSVSKTCHVCHGEGVIVENPCPKCRGAGRHTAKQNILVRVPAGISTGQRLRIKGEGQAGERGGPPGDLYVLIQVDEHPFFEREEDDLLCEIPVAMVTAIVGGEIDVPTLKGKIRMKVPPGTQAGKIFRLKGKGFTRLSGHGKGDQLVKLIVEIPIKISSNQKKLLQEFEQLSQSNNHPLTSNFYKRVEKHLHS